MKTANLRIENPITGENYECQLSVIQDSERSWSAIVVNLPGAGGCGDTEQEAIDDAKRSVVGLIESYAEDGVDVPWCPLPIE